MLRLKFYLDDLMSLSNKSIFYGLEESIKNNDKELKDMGIELNLEGFNSFNQEHITYEDALKLVKSNGSETVWGEGLKRRDEILITQYFGNKFVWIHFSPFISEGFPYKRLETDNRYSKTCDLIAPNGAGEIVGVAEKITNPEELIQNLIEKGQKENIHHFWNYIALRRFGMPPHGGLGAAPERIIYGLLNLDHIRLTRSWPRYPDRKINVSKENSLNDYGDSKLKSLIDKYDLK
jgi:asparaginyl-tRNA synthetase